MNRLYKNVARLTAYINKIKAKFNSEDAISIGL